MARKKNVQKIHDEITRLQQELESVRQAEAERLGSLAVKAGLSDIDVSDKELLAALKEVAARFQSESASA
ncbi:TraC family protein [Shinella sumterensis]|uniref:TraC family protein n=1 Tax=Shinella sumterensis TaxID=1967501 RepID=A0AA50HBS1_9HYPH|nr:TraC family protein [Shinella sumterensis]WLS01387.1 TraC family protein [Shinella sumterensis]